MRLRRQRWRRALAGVVIGVAVGLVGSGCTGIPTSGPVQQVSLPGNPNPPYPINIAPVEPEAGASPAAILDGFLAAVASSTATRFDVAREYLTPAAAAIWDPRAATTIYESTGHPPVTTASSAVVQAPAIGRLDPAGHFTAVYEPDFRHDFGLVQVDGQWRISDPGTGVLLPQYLYDSYYQSVPVYFLNPDGRHVVAEHVHLNQVDATPTGTMQALLWGPSAWLGPVVRTAIPMGTALATPSVVVDGGIAQVSLTDQVGQLGPDQLVQLAAQVLWTLSRFSSISGVHLSVRGTTLSIPGQDPAGVLTWMSVASYLPFPEPTSRDGLVVQNSLLARVASAVPGPVPVVGAFGRPGGAADVSGLAVSNDLAVAVTVSANATQLRMSSGGAAPITVLAGQGLTRPQVDAARTAWVFRAATAGPVLARCTATTCDQTEVTDLAGRQVVAFRISPDQTRIAVVATDGTATVLGLLRLSTADGLRADGWLPIPATTPRGVLTQFRDVAWTSDTQFLVLGAPASDGYLSTFLLDADGSFIAAQGPTEDVQATSLAALPRAESGLTALVMTATGAVRRFDTPTQWPVLVPNGVTAVACAG